MSPEELKILQEMILEVAMVRNFLLEEKSNLKYMIERVPSENKPDLRGKLDTVCSLLKYIKRVHSYLMGIAKENKNE